MSNKTFILRKISTGGTLLVRGKSVKDIIKTRGLDPNDWEKFNKPPKSEDPPVGNIEGDGSGEDN